MDSLLFLSQIAQHRRVYLAHFDTDGNVDVTTTTTTEAEKPDAGTRSVVVDFLGRMCFKDKT